MTTPIVPLVIVLAVLGLGGCAYMPGMAWPFGKEKPAPVAPPAAPAEEIGPRVEAVPVEPVIQENMMTPHPPAAADAPVADEPFGF